MSKFNRAPDPVEGGGGLENKENKFDSFKQEIQIRLRYPSDFSVLEENEQKMIENEISDKADEIIKRIESSNLSSEEKIKLEELIQDLY